MPVQVIDLFCGIGGLTKGLELANLDVVAGVDSNEHCRFAYEANTNADFILSDITEINEGELLHLLSPETTCILVGCAPCQPFSQYSQRYRKIGHKDDKWKLLYSFLNLVDKIRPSVVSMENVPELHNERIFMDFVRHLKNVGYYCSWSIVYCPDYGVPQKRKRLVLLASLFGEVNMIPAQYSPNNYRTVREVIGNLPHLKDGEKDPKDLMHCSPKLSKINVERIRQSTPGGTWHDWDEHLKLSCHKKESGKSYSRPPQKLISIFKIYNSTNQCHAQSKSFTAITIFI